METLNHRAYQVTQLACIVNQLHRMAMRMPPDALPSGITLSTIHHWVFVFFSAGRRLSERYRILLF